MYLMGLGGKPVGECYVTPPEGGESFLVGHYYSGGNVKLLRFKEPLGGPEEGSIEKRLRDLEDWKFYMQAYAEKFIKDLCKSTGVTYKTFEQFKPEAGSPPQHKNDNPEMEYLVSNFDWYQGSRG